MQRSGTTYLVHYYKALDEGTCLIDIRTRYYAQFSVCVSLPPIAIGATAA